MSTPGGRRKLRNSWRAKLRKPSLPRLQAVPESMVKRLGPGLMIIPTALEVDAMIRKIPRGKVCTMAEIRRRLAHWHNADVACALVTGIFLRIVAEAAEEDRAAGSARVTPYWRVVGEDGRLNPKFPGGTAVQ